jgi:hypothetical protein
MRLFFWLFLITPSLCAAENPRLQRHFNAVIAELEAAPVPMHDLGAAVRRGWLITTLADYRDAGRFPLNLHHAVPTPYFVDDLGTRCAVAHLMDTTGETALVSEIARSRNNAYVAELADDPRVVQWLGYAGLTAAEAARIQPTYCVLPANRHCAARLNTEHFSIYEAYVVDTTPRTIKITAVHGADALLSVGEQIVLRARVSGAPLEHGEQVLIYGGSENASPTLTHRIANGQASISDWTWRIPETNPGLAPIPLETLLEILMTHRDSNGCREAIVQHNPDAGYSICEDGSRKPVLVSPSGGGGCQQAAGAPLDLAGLLLLGLGTLLLLGALRRRRRA